MAKGKDKDEKSKPKSNYKNTFAEHNEAKKKEFKRLKKELSKPDAETYGVGRPTLYTEELANYIIEKVSSAKVGLHVLCREDPKMPAQSSINLWRFKYPEFSARYLLAKQHQSHLMVEFCEEISDEKDTYVDVTGQSKVDPGGVAHQKLRIETRKWYASKLNPQAFGDKKTIDQLKEETESMKAELMAIRAQLADKNKKEY